MKELKGEKEKSTITIGDFLAHVVETGRQIKKLETCKVIKVSNKTSN